MVTSVSPTSHLWIATEVTPGREQDEVQPPCKQTQCVSVVEMACPGYPRRVQVSSPFCSCTASPPRNPERCCLRHLRQTLQEHTSKTHGPLAESGRCLSEFTAEPWGGTVRGPGLAYERVWAVSYLLFYPKIYLAEKEWTDAAQKNLWDTLTMGICEPKWNSWILVDSGISHQLISYKRYNNLVRKFVVVSAMQMGGGWLESRWTLSCLWSIILWT